MVGGGKGGSWEMRGVQLGHAMCARVTSVPIPEDWRWADLVVLVKRAARGYARMARAHRVPIVWDALDFWSQPAQNGWDRAQSHALLTSEIKAIQPAMVIGATRAMAEASGGAYLPHHTWAGLEPAEARETVAVVAYQGNATYLGQWGRRLQQACVKRGWAFLVNPPDLRAADIVVTFRDGPWDGYMCQQWKSGVKVGNAIAAGRPIIGQPSAALAELHAPSTTIDRADYLDAALDAWTPYAARAAAVDVCRTLAPSVRLANVAQQYRQILTTVRAACAA
jgi:hypothetical protein